VVSMRFASAQLGWYHGVPFVPEMDEGDF